MYRDKNKQLFWSNSKAKICSINNIIRSLKSAPEDLKNGATLWFWTGTTFSKLLKKRLFFICHLSYIPATVLFNLANLCIVLTCFNQRLSNYSALKQKSSLCYNDPNTHKEPPCPFPTIHQVIGLLCQNNHWSMLSIFPLTDTVMLHICVPALTVISVGWIICVMTTDASQQPAVSFQKAQHRVKRLTIQW